MVRIEILDCGGVRSSPGREMSLGEGVQRVAKAGNIARQTQRDFRC